MSLDISDYFHEGEKMITNVSRYPQRVRNELRLWELTVLRIERTSAGSQHVVLGGDTLDGLSSRGSDDHTRVFFPKSGSHSVPLAIIDEGIVWANGIRPLPHDHTPLYNKVCHKLTLDFYIYDGGVANTWATNAREDDKLMIDGPRGFLVVPKDYAYQVHVYDESGIPMLCRRLEPLCRLVVRPHVMVLVSAQNAAYQDYFAHLDGFTLQWFTSRDERAVNEHLSWLSVPADDHLI